MVLPSGSDGASATAVCTPVVQVCGGIGGVPGTVAVSAEHYFSSSVLVGSWSESVSLYARNFPYRMFKRIFTCTLAP